MALNRFYAGARRACFAAAVIGIVLSLGTTAANAIATASKPNIVLIVTDDEDVAVHKFMPKTKALIEDRGTVFENYFVSYPFCCPSRASILRGQYAHNTQVLGNQMPYGGYEKMQALGLEESTLAIWLREAGYRTAMVGKYLNGYVPRKHGVAAGWTDWYVAGSGAHPSYNYWLNENGHPVYYRDRPEDYLNDVLTMKSVDVIRSASQADEPFFLYILPLTPHSPSTAAPRHQGLFADAKLPRPPAFDEADVSDKPALIRKLPRLDERTVGFMEDEYRRRLRSLQAIDDMVETVVETLRATGELDNTYIVYSSDNGFSIGEHRLPAGKVYPYDENLRVPMAMRGPGIPKGLRLDAMTLNIDLAPTLAEIVGIETPDFVDGRSFLPLFENPEAPWRTSFLIESRQFEDQMIKLALRQGVSRDELDSAAIFDGIRTESMVYVEYGTGEREFYDLAEDPFQRDNRIEDADPALIATLSARLKKLASCAGSGCRDIEDLPLKSKALIAKDEAKGKRTPVAPAPAEATVTK